MFRFDADGARARSSAAGRSRPSTCCRSARGCRCDGDTAAGARLAHRARRRGWTTTTAPRASSRASCAAYGVRSRSVAAPVFLGGRAVGRGDRLERGPSEPFPEGAEQRIAYFAELAAQALANAQAREELAASRARIVQAGDEERRRLERNLHDGAQQRLVSLALMLRLAARRHPDDEDLERAGEELSHALQELRELARGIHPAVLTERGLEPAAARARRPRAAAGRARRSTLDGAPPRPGRGRRLLRRQRGADQRRQVRRRLARAGPHRPRNGGAARSRSPTTASGGADPDGGSGLRGLADRVEALGGHLDRSTARSARAPPSAPSSQPKGDSPLSVCATASHACRDGAPLSSRAHRFGRRGAEGEAGGDQRGEEAERGRSGGDRARRASPGPRAGCR